MSYVHHIWSTATPTRQRIMQFTLVALLAFAVGAATVAYGDAITRRFAGAEPASEQQSLPVQPEAPAVALPRGEASQPNGYWNYVHPAAPEISVPRGAASQSNSYWDYVHPDASAIAVPEEVQEESQPHGYWEYVRPDSAD